MFPRVVREGLTGTTLDEFLKFADQHLEVISGEIGVLGVSIAEQFFLHLLDQQLERLLVLGWQFLHAHDNIAVHLNEATVAVPSESRIAAGFGQCIHGFVVQAEVQDGVHHAWHGFTST